MKNLLNIIILSAIFFSSCNKEIEYVFDKKPEQRIAEKKQEYKNALTNSEYGWKYVSYPNKEQFGGFTFIMKFDKEGKVKMAGDIAKLTKNSSYSLKIKENIALCFDSYNFIHFTVDPAIAKVGQGIGGDQELLIDAYNDKEIKFTGRKTKKALTFVKATKEDWDNIEKVNLNYERSKLLTGVEYFTSVTLPDSKRVIVKSLAGYRFIMFQTQVGDKINIERRPYAIDENGIYFEKVDIYGNELTNIQFTDNADKIKFNYADQELSITRGYTSPFKYKGAIDKVKGGIFSGQYIVENGQINLYEFPSKELYQTDRLLLYPNSVGKEKNSAFGFYRPHLGDKAFTLIRIDVNYEQEDQMILNIYKDASDEQVLIGDFDENTLKNGAGIIKRVLTGGKYTIEYLGDDYPITFVNSSGFFFTMTKVD